MPSGLSIPVGTTFRENTIRSFNEFEYFTGVTSLAGNAFYNTASVNTFVSIVLPSNISSFGNGAFYRMAALQKINIPSKVTNLANYVFSGCTGLRIILCYPSSPPTIQGYTFQSVSGIFYVPDESVDAYKAANRWSSFASRIHPLSEYTG